MTKKISLTHEHRLDDLTSIAKTVNPLAQQLLGEQGLLIADLLSDWQNIVGKELSRFTLPRRLVFRKNEQINGTLEILTANGAVALETQQRTPQIIEKINVYFGYSAVTKIKMIQNSIPENFAIPKNTFENVKKNLVSADEEIYITSVVEKINNNSLRHRLADLGRAVLSNRKD